MDLESSSTIGRTCFMKSKTRLGFMTIFVSSWRLQRGHGGREAGAICVCVFCNNGETSVLCVCFCVSFMEIAGPLA